MPNSLDLQRVAVEHPPAELDAAVSERAAIAVQVHQVHEATKAQLAAAEQTLIQVRDRERQAQQHAASATERARSCRRAAAAGMLAGEGNAKELAAYRRAQDESDVAGLATVLALFKTRAAERDVLRLRLEACMTEAEELRAMADAIELYAQKLALPLVVLEGDLEIRGGRSEELRQAVIRARERAAEALRALDIFSAETARLEQLHPER